MKSPSKRTNEKRLREFLQIACTAESSSIVVNPNAIGSVQPNVGSAIIAGSGLKQVRRFPIIKYLIGLFPILGEDLVSEFFLYWNK